MFPLLVKSSQALALLVGLVDSAVKSLVQLLPRTKQWAELSTPSCHNVAVDCEESHLGNSLQSTSRYFIHGSQVAQSYSPLVV